jgi:chromosome partitioning protein
VSRVIAIANQKGGVGKTTTSINLAASMTALCWRVLLVDLDPQGNATMGSGVDKHRLEHTSYDLLMHELPLSHAVVEPPHAGYALVPSNGGLIAAEVELLGVARREYRLREALAPVLDDYRLILIDCPPSLNMLTVNALVAADGVIIPIQCEYYALEGLSSLLDTVRTVCETLNPKLEVQGLLRTMYDARNNLADEVSAQLVEHFEDKVYRTLIPRNVRLAEAPSHGLPALMYDRASRGAQAYLSLAGELVHQDNRARRGMMPGGGESGTVPNAGARSIPDGS